MISLPDDLWDDVIDEVERRATSLPGEMTSLTFYFGSNHCEIMDRLTVLCTLCAVNCSFRRRAAVRLARANERITRIFVMLLNSTAFFTATQFCTNLCAYVQTRVDTRTAFEFLDNREIDVAWPFVSRLIHPKSDLSIIEQIQVLLNRFPLLRMSAESATMHSPNISGSACNLTRHTHDLPNVYFHTRALVCICASTLAGVPLTFCFKTGPFRISFLASALQSNSALPHKTRLWFQNVYITPPPAAVD
jgi:hypothetical protein